MSLSAYCVLAWAHCPQAPIASLFISGLAQSISAFGSLFIFGVAHHHIAHYHSWNTQSSPINIIKLARINIQSTQWIYHKRKSPCGHHLHSLSTCHERISSQCSETGFLWPHPSGARARPGRRAMCKHRSVWSHRCTCTAHRRLPTEWRWNGL